MSVYPQWTSVGDGIAWAASDGDSLLYVSTDGEREVIRFNARQPPASVSETDKDRYFSAYASAYDLSSDDMPAIKSSTPVVTRRPTIASLLHDASANEFWIAGFDPTNILHGHVGNTWTVRPVNDSTASPTERWIVPDGVSLIAIRGRVGVGVRTSQLGVDRAVVLSFDPAR